jgi:hypothetical protein
MADEAANPGDNAESSAGTSAPQTSSPAPAQAPIDILEADEDGAGVVVSHCI